jgi:hypothetical protein
MFGEMAMSGQPKNPERAALVWLLKAVGISVLLVVLAAVLASECHLGHSRPVSRRIACRINVEDIGWSLALHAKDHGGALPEDLEELLAPAGHLIGWQYLCPVMRRPAGQEHGFPGEVDYAYLGAGLTLQELEALPYPGFPIVFDNEGNHVDGTRSVFFSSGIPTFLKTGGMPEEVNPVMKENDFKGVMQRCIQEYEKGGKEALAARLREYLEGERNGGPKEVSRRYSRPGTWEERADAKG